MLLFTSKKYHNFVEQFAIRYLIILNEHNCVVETGCMDELIYHVGGPPMRAQG
jgi:hypothetical protein